MNNTSLCLDGALSIRKGSSTNSQGRNTRVLSLPRDDNTFAAQGLGISKGTIGRVNDSKNSQEACQMSFNLLHESPFKKLPQEGVKEKNQLMSMQESQIPMTHYILGHFIFGRWRVERWQKNVYEYEDAS